MKYDCVIAGAGVVGSAIARELSRYDLNIIVLEKASDVCEGTSKANSGIVHAGYDAVPGTKKAYFNVLGSKMMENLSKELDFSFIRNGSIVLCFSEKDLSKLEELKERGLKNGVVGLTIMTGDEIRKKEPNLSSNVVYALYAPTGGIVCPFGLTIALAENACVNGVQFNFNEEVIKVTKGRDDFQIVTSKGHYEAGVFINAAGVYADKLHNMLCEDKISIQARKGEYCLYDKKVGKMVTSTIFQLPSELGKGILVTPTVHGNLLMGPTAVDTPDKEGVNTTLEGLSKVQEEAKKSINEIPRRQVITSFAGLRAHSDTGDFIVGRTSVPGYFEAAGIESPGLSAAPAIGVYIAKEVSEYTEAIKKTDFISKRVGVKALNNMTNEEKQKLIEENPQYANVICRCEVVTEGEIVDAIKRPLGATTLDGIKRRTRAGMGRCQAGFCSNKTVEILARELGCSEEEITKHGPGSEVIYPHKGL